jgi:signal transduction histidine kinase/ActR/RegA family two-component response regulator
MLDRDTIQLVASLADIPTRGEATVALAAQVGADALLLFVEDVEVDAMLPAPGVPQTVAGGASWRELLQRCRATGTHRGEVSYPSVATIIPAVACAGSGVALVFVGREVDAARMESICLILPLLGSTLRAEHAAAAATGELRVAREDARHAGVLARSLDGVRADLERQAKSLNEARARAEEAIRTKDEFLAMLGHELRNPLAPIMTALQIMRLKGITSREQEILERQVTQLMRLVDDLLDVARIARGKVELRRECLELATVTSRAIEMASPLLEQKRQELVVDIPTEGLSVDADPDRLAQIFSNLLTNAAKYSDANTRVTFSARRGKNDTVIVRVKDEGHGIEPHMLDAIFEQFVQQPQALERSQGGLGLGLAIVKNLVTLHGGTVRARSEGQGKGSELVVELPLSQARVRTSEPAVRRQAAHEKRLTNTPNRVLVVDDNEDAAEMLSDALTVFGYLVRTAADGPAALVVADEFRPEIALLDIGLPVMDGYELGRRLRKSHLGMQLVALTGYGQASDKALSTAAGFDAHLVKPVDLDELRRLLCTLPRPQAAPGDPV